MGLRDFFEDMDRKRNDGYERSLAKYNAQKVISDKAEMAALLPRKKLPDIDPLVPQLIKYAGKGEYRQFKITAKDGRSVLVQHPDSIEAANIGEDFLKIERYTGERREVFADVPIQSDFWRPVPPRFTYVEPADGIIVDMATMTYDIPAYGILSQPVMTSKRTWPGHHYVYDRNGQLKWVD